MLSQGPAHSDKPVCFASRTMSAAETNYSTIEKEMLAITWAVQYFRTYLFGKRFTIVTDHKPFTWLMNFKQPDSKIIRWRLQLQEYDFEVIYKKGSQNVIADSLSQPEASINHNEALPTPRTICPISEKPLNDFNIQLLFKIIPTTNYTTLTPFKHKLRREFCKPDFQYDDVINILRQSLKPNKTCVAFSLDHVFQMVEQAYQTFFSADSTFKLIRCLTFLPEITNSTEIKKNYNRLSL